jgi:DNA-directed RNA polymerases I, II, and III subunit RPABC2
MENYMTKFEKIRVLGQRAEQIARGAPPLVDISGMDDAFQIALKELSERKIPLKIHRRFPDGSVKVFRVADMLFD